MSQLEECSFEEKEEESPMLDSNLKRKDVLQNATNADKPRNGEINPDDSKKNIATTKAENEAAERGRSTGKKSYSTRKSFGKHFGQVSHSKSITTIPTTQVKRKRNNSLMKNFCIFSNGSNHEQMMKQMYDESLVEWRKFQNSRIIEPKKMQTKEMMNGATKTLQLSVGGQKKFTLKDLQKIKKEDNGNQEQEEDKDVKSIGMVVRRKSCCCSHCGQLNSQQLQLVDVPFVPTQHKKFYDIKYRIKTILAAPIRPPIRSNNATGGGTIIIQKSQPSNAIIESQFPNSPHALHNNNNANSTHRQSYVIESSINNGTSTSFSRPLIKPSKHDNYGFASVVSNTSIDRSPKEENNNNTSQKQNQVVKFKERNSQRESSIFNQVALLPVHSMEESNMQDQEMKTSYSKNTPNISGFQKNLGSSLGFKAKKSLESKQLAGNKNQQQSESVLERSLKERNRGMRALENVLHNTKGSTNFPQGESPSASSSNNVRDQYQIVSQLESAIIKKQSTPAEVKSGNDFKKTNQIDFTDANHYQNGEQQQQSQPLKPQQRLMESLTQFRDRYIRQFREHPINPHGSSQDKHQIMRDTSSASNSNQNGFSLGHTHKHTNHLVLQGEKQDQSDKSIENLIVFSDTHSAALSSPYFVELKGEEYRFDQNFNKKNVYQRVFSPPFPEGIQLDRHNYSPSRPETLHSQRKHKNNNQLNSNNTPNGGSVNSAYFPLSHHRRNLSSSDLFSKTHKESTSTSTARSAKFSCYYKPFKTIKTNNLQNLPETNAIKKRQQQQQIQGVQLEVMINSNATNTVTTGSNVNSSNNIVFNNNNNAPMLPVIPSNLKGADMKCSQQNQYASNIQNQELGNQSNQVKSVQQMPSMSKQSFSQHKRSNQSSLSNPKSILDTLLQENLPNKHQQSNSNSSSKRVLIKSTVNKDSQNHLNQLQKNNNHSIQGAASLPKRDKQQSKI